MLNAFYLPDQIWNLLQIPLVNFHFEFVCRLLLLLLLSLPLLLLFLLIPTKLLIQSFHLSGKTEWIDEKCCCSVSSVDDQHKMLRKCTAFVCMCSTLAYVHQSASSSRRNGKRRLMLLFFFANHFSRFPSWTFYEWQWSAEKKRTLCVPIVFSFAG